MAARQVVNLLRGSVRLEVRGEFPERFLNLCARRQVSFWGVERPDSHTLRLTVALPHRMGLETLAERTGCTLTEERRGGLPPFLMGFRRRYAFLTGLALALAAVCVLSRFVLVVRVEGNERVSTQAILTALARQGLHPGVYGPGVKERELSDRTLLEMGELSWMTVNLHGILAQVVVRERVPPPELVDESVHGSIVAEAPGIISRVEEWAGDAMVEKGDTVVPGDVLIRGMVELEPAPWSETPPQWLPTRAQGRVWGRTWRTLTAAIPLTAPVKRPTGEESRGWWVTFLGRRVKFFENSGIDGGSYDKISQAWTLPLPGIGALPFSLHRETRRGYELAPAEVDPVAARAMLEERLLARLEALLGGTGRQVSHSFSAATREGVMYVTLTAECEEELGRFVPGA